MQTCIRIHMHADMYTHVRAHLQKVFAWHALVEGEELRGGPVLMWHHGGELDVEVGGEPIGGLQVAQQVGAGDAAQLVLRHLCATSAMMSVMTSAKREVGVMI